MNSTSRQRNAPVPSGQALIAPACPKCRQILRRHALFALAVFEPSQMETQGQALLPLRRGRGAEPRGFIAESDEESMSEDEEDEDDDMSDFIVQSDEDEEEKDARRDAKRSSPKGKRAIRRVILDSDDEETEEVRDVTHSPVPTPQRTPPPPPPPAEILSHKLPPSTKMKVSISV